MGVLTVSAMVKIADADNQPRLLWGAVTCGLVIVCTALIPLPFLRVGVAFVAAFIAMTGYKIYAER